MVNEPLFKFSPVEGEDLLEVFVLDPFLKEIAEPEHFGALLMNRGLAVLMLGIPQCPPHRSVGVQLVLYGNGIADFEQLLALF